MTWPPETKTIVLNRIAAGESVREICRDEGMPSRQTVRVWLLTDPEFVAIHTRAREQQAEAQADKMEDLEDRILSGELDPNAARVVLGSMQWRTERMAPKRWGAKSSLELGGEVAVKSLHQELSDLNAKRNTGGGT